MKALIVLLVAVSSQLAFAKDPLTLNCEFWFHDFNVSGSERQRVVSGTVSDNTDFRFEESLQTAGELGEIKIAGSFHRRNNRDFFHVEISNAESNQYYLYSDGELSVNGHLFGRTDLDKSRSIYFICRKAN